MKELYYFNMHEKGGVINDTFLINTELTTTN